MRNRGGVKDSVQNVSGSWRCVLELESNRRKVAGCEKELRSALGSGADLRIYTAFRHNEHLDTASSNSELVHEVSEFRVTHLVKKEWAAGIMTLRMPIVPPSGFGPRPSMSFFLYNEDGSQAIARPYLDGLPTPERPASHPARTHPEMPRYHELDRWDDETNAPSSNFIYEFERYRFFVSATWREVLSHDSNGVVRSGSLEALKEAFLRGAEIKVGLAGLCSDLPDGEGPDHELFVQAGPGYFHEETGVFTAGTHPVVRVAPGVPMRYRSGNWDFGWLMPRTDGFVECWLCDPRSLRFRKERKQVGIRWFVRD